MDKFFSLAGEFVSHEIITVGETPRVTVIAVFTYPNGESRYDGRAWTYRIFF